MMKITIQTMKIRYILKWKYKISGVFINYIFHNGYAFHFEHPLTEEEMEKLNNDPLAE